MADKKITALSALASTAVDPAADLLHIIDYSASPVNKKITVANLFDQVNTNTSIYGNSLIFEVGQAAAVNSHIRVAVGANATTDGAVTINDDGVAYVDFVVKSLGSDQALVVDAGADTVTINGDSIAALDFVVKGDTTTLIHADGGLDAVGFGTASPDTAYTVTVAATGTNGIKSAGAIDVTGTISATSNATFGATASGVMILPSVESISATSATAVDCSITHTTTLVTTSDAAGNGALANGTIGQIKYITLVSRDASGDDYVLTPATRNGYATITFDSIWDSVTLIYQTAGWTVVSSGGSVNIA